MNLEAKERSASSINPSLLNLLLISLFMKQRIMGEVRQRLATLLSILIITPVGFYSKFYAGPAAPLVNNYLGGTFYVIFWSLVVYLFLPSHKTWMIATAILFATCLLEFLQLYHHPILELIRGSFIGVTILGNSFSWTDFPWYFLGAGIGWFWIERIHSKNRLIRLEDC